MLYKQNTLRAQGKEYASQISELKKEKKELTEKKKDLEAFKEYVKTDDYIEETAREKFGLVHKGEIIFEPENQKWSHISKRYVTSLLVFGCFLFSLIK